MDLVNDAPSLTLGELRMPTLVIYTQNDTVIDTDVARRRFDEIGAERKLLVGLPGAVTQLPVTPQRMREMLRRVGR